MTFVAKNKHIVAKNRIDFGCVPIKVVKVTKYDIIVKIHHIYACKY